MDRWRITYDQYLQTPETVLQDMLLLMEAEGIVADEMQREQAT